MLNNSKKMVVGGSDPKSNPILATDTINGISATDTTNGISTRKLHPLFVKPTQIGNQEIFSQSNSSTARGGRNAEPIDASMGLLTAHTADKLKSVIGPVTRVQGLMDNSDRITSSHGISKVGADRVSETKAYRYYIENSEFETMKVRT